MYGGPLERIAEIQTSFDEKFLRMGNAVWHTVMDTADSNKGFQATFCSVLILWELFYP